MNRTTKPSSAPQLTFPHQLLPSDPIEGELVLIGQEITLTSWIVGLEWLARLDNAATPKVVWQANECTTTHKPTSTAV